VLRKTIDPQNFVEIRKHTHRDDQSISFQVVIIAVVFDFCLAGLLFQRLC